MARSTNILGRVVRNIRKYRKDFNETNTEFIYDEINEAQKDLISRVMVEKSFDITTVSGQEDYPLTALDAAGDIIRDVIGFITPDSWYDDVIYQPIELWDEVKKSDLSSEQAMYYTIFEKTLKFYPTISDGETVTLLVHLKQPTTTISGSVEPEVPAIWDKALEYFATAQFLTAELERYYMDKYFADIADKSPTDFIKQTNTVMYSNDEGAE